MSEVESTGSDVKGDQVSSSQPQTASQDEPITVAGGDSIVSFDELDAVTARPQKEKSEKPKEKPKKKEKAEKVAKEEPEEEEASDDATQDSKEAKAKEQPAKRLKLKDGDQDVELSVSAAVPVKINGREELVSIDDLRNNFAGKVVWDKKFHELDRERKTFLSERTNLQSKLQGFFKQHETDPLGAYFSLAEENGYDVVKLKQDFYRAAAESVEKFNTMSEDEQARHWLQEENTLLRQKHESARARDEEVKARGRIQATVQSLQETHTITPDQFSQTYFELEKLQEAGRFKDEITPELVAQVHIHQRNYQSLNQTFDEMKLNLSEEERQKAIQELMQYAQKFPELGPTDLKDIAHQVYGLEKAKNLSRRVNKNKGDQAAKQVSKPRNPASEPTFFDDL